MRAEPTPGGGVSKAFCAGLVNADLNENAAFSVKSTCPEIAADLSGK